MSDRLTLRAPVTADASALALHANDAEISKWLLALPHPYRVSDAQDYIRRQHDSDKRGQSFVICVDGEAVGCIGTVGEFGYWIGRAHWGQGIVTEAALAVLSRHFESDGWDLDSSHAVENHRSARVLEKSGFRYTGATTRRVGVHNGLAHDHRLMRLTSADWQART